MVLSRLAKNIEDALKKKLFSYLACSQIWLKFRVDYCHFGDNTEFDPQ
jgi:hypothetical protein